MVRIARDVALCRAMYVRTYLVRRSGDSLLVHAYCMFVRISLEISRTRRVGVGRICFVDAMVSHGIGDGIGERQ